MVESDKALYEQVAKKIMKYELDRVGGIYDLKREWRHGPKKHRKGPEDIEYFKKFDKKLTGILDAKKLEASLFDKWKKEDDIFT